MQRFITAVISIAGAILVPTAVMPQDPGVCFMRDSSGRVIDLNGLCGGPTKPRVFQAKIKRRPSGTIAIDVVFNGQHKFEMLLDTGATYTSITPAMANAIKPVPVGVGRFRIANGQVIEKPMGRVNSITVGGAVVSNATVSVGAIPLLGQNFFEGYDVTIKRDVVEFRAR